MSAARGSRQSFLGAEAQDIFERAKVAVLGLGGGGSHIVQQLAHVGFRRFVICDPDVVEDTNLNRLVGATEEDAKARTRKVDVAARLIQGLAPNACIEAFFSKWEHNAETLRGVDLVFGCHRQASSSASASRLPGELCRGGTEIGDADPCQ